VTPARLEARFGRTRFHFGWGAAEGLAATALSLGRRVVIVTSPGCAGHGDWIRALRDRIADAGGTAEVLPRIRPNPDVEDIDAVRESAARSDVVIGIGGGSVLDGSKALAVAAASALPAADWLRRGTVPNDAPRKQLVLAPTTAGTGSDLSFGAILSDRSRGFKGGLRGAALAADAAVVDPALTVTMPRALTAETGFDILTHAFESYVSRRTTSHARALSMQAVTIVGRMLPRVLSDPQDREARSALSYASSMMGLNLAHVGTCLPHRLQYAIGGLAPHISHPAGLAWIYPVWIHHVYPFVQEDIADLLDALGQGRPSSGADAAARIEAWLAAIGIGTRPTVELDPADLASRVTGNLAADPIPAPESRLTTMYEEIFR